MSSVVSGAYLSYARRHHGERCRAGSTVSQTTYSSRTSAARVRPARGAVACSTVSTIWHDPHHRSPRKASALNSYPHPPKHTTTTKSRQQSQTPLPTPHESRPNCESPLPLFDENAKDPRELGGLEPAWVLHLAGSLDGRPATRFEIEELQPRPTRRPALRRQRQKAHPIHRAETFAEGP